MHEDLERLEIILKLTRDLGVNLAGVEIILNMREKMEAMQKQVVGFIETLNQELSERATQQPSDNNSLMPMIQINSGADGRMQSAGRRGSEKRGRGGKARIKLRKFALLSAPSRSRFCAGPLGPEGTPGRGSVLIVWH